MCVVETRLPGLKLLKRGKVRDVYDLGNKLLVVATDRISAFDVILPTPIPGKGRILTQISLFWFNKMQHIVPNHLSPATLADVVHDEESRRLLAGRSMVVRKAEPLPLEAIVRGYLSGSALKEYRERGTVCGMPLPPGLQEAGRLPEPLFTPSTKAEGGTHDENITFGRLAGIIGADLAARVREISLRLYGEASRYALERGIIIADTKFEFGLIGGELVLIDELLTPDSSRFWPADSYVPGQPQPSFDKQYVRDYLEEIGWDKRPPAPSLPPEVVAGTVEKYREALRRLTGGDEKYCLAAGGTVEC
ncbi:MAG: phosphoribosylaminoimidazolesuccinocarboxamide synthase [Desulfotomaculales bacterium]